MSLIDSKVKLLDDLNKSIRSSLNSEEYENYDKFSKVTDKSGLGSVFAARDVEGRSGVQFQLPIKQLFIDPVVKDHTEVLKGSGDGLTLADFQYMIHDRRWEKMLTAAEYNEMKVGEQLVNHLRDELLESARDLDFKLQIQNLVKPLFYQSTDPFQKPKLAANHIPYNEAVALSLNCGLDAVADSADFINSQRIVFGNNNAFLNAAGGFTPVDVKAVLAHAQFTIANGAGFTIDFLDDMIELAMAGSRPALKKTPYYDRPIKPYKIMEGLKGYTQSQFILLVGTKIKRKLERLQEYKDQLLRGMRESSSQFSIFNGSSYLGQFKNLDIVFEPELDKYALNETTDICLLLGASAAVMAKKAPKILMDQDDYENHIGFAYTDYIGIRPIMYPSKTDRNKKGINEVMTSPGIIIGVVKTA